MPFTIISLLGALLEGFIKSFLEDIWDWPKSKKYPPSFKSCIPGAKKISDAKLENQFMLKGPIIVCHSGERVKECS